MTIDPQTRKMLSLMAQVILSDGHIRDSELDALVETAQALSLSDESGAPLSPEQIRTWFSSYLQELNEVWSTEGRDITLTRLILSLAEWPEKQAVVDALTKISKADGNEHKEEKLLISIVRAYWQYEGLDAPGATINV